MYENIVIVAADCTSEEEEELMKRVQGYMERQGAEIVRVDDWGVRKLAYLIKGKDKGQAVDEMPPVDVKDLLP